MDEGTINWNGSSGKAYKYWIYKIGTQFKDEPGNYVFAKETSPKRWSPVYIGETDSLARRIPNHEKLPCITRNESGINRAAI